MGFRSFPLLQPQIFIHIKGDTYKEVQEDFFTIIFIMADRSGVYDYDERIFFQDKCLHVMEEKSFSNLQLLL